ncbi:MAG TPA: DoxX family protein [Flavipsychrobacter sp.]|nr:DoxX family protein [Flavipsychrobacter sp.]
MKKTKVLYWVFTGLFSFLMFGSAIPDIFSSAVAVKGMHDGLGYPTYFIPFIGTAKLLGVIAILTPGHARFKEWAFAGLLFDLIGATYSIICSGQPAPNWLFMILPLTIAFTSYFLHHKLLRSKAQKRNAINTERATIVVSATVKESARTAAAEATVA